MHLARLRQLGRAWEWARCRARDHDRGSGIIRLKALRVTRETRRVFSHPVLAWAHRPALPTSAGRAGTF